MGPVFFFTAACQALPTCLYSFDLCIRKAVLMVVASEGKDEGS